MIQADATQVRQVVMNLVTNASEAIGDEEGVIRVITGLVQADRAYLARRDVGERRPAGRYVSLEVADTGCGMNDATRERIFEPFFTTKFTGRGLGLAAVLGIVRGHRGGPAGRDRAGQGHHLHGLLPAPGQAPSAPSPEPEVEPRPAGEATILVVDDEPAVRRDRHEHARGRLGTGCSWRPTATRR